MIHSVAKTLYSLGLVYGKNGCGACASFDYQSYLLHDFSVEIRLDAKGDDKEALKYHKEAFRLRRTLLGADHLHVAQSLDSICALYVRQQNHEKALQGLKEALRIRTLRLGNDNLEGWLTTLCCSLSCGMIVPRLSPIIDPI